MLDVHGAKSVSQLQTSVQSRALSKIRGSDRGARAEPATAQAHCRSAGSSFTNGGDGMRESRTASVSTRSIPRVARFSDGDRFLTMTEHSDKRMKAHCPTCDRETNSHIHGAFDQPWDHTDGENSTNGQVDHKLLQCLGCDTVFYYRSSWDSEDWDHDYDPRTRETVTYYPSRIETYPKPDPSNEGAKWANDLHKIDWPLNNIMGEMYKAAEGGSYILASVGLRTALDRAMEILGIDPGHYLVEKLASLKERGFIGPSEHETLSVVAEAGNAAAHQAWSPGREEFAQLLVVLEQFIYRNVVIGQKALAVKNNIPAKQPRPKKEKAPVIAGSLPRAGLIAPSVLSAEARQF